MTDLPLFDYERYTITVGANDTRRVPSWTSLKVVSTTGTVKLTLGTGAPARELPTGFSVLAPHLADGTGRRATVDSATLVNEGGAPITVVIDVAVGLELLPSDLEITSIASTVNVAVAGVVDVLPADADGSSANWKYAAVSVGAAGTGTLLAAQVTPIRVHGVGIFPSSAAPAISGSAVLLALLRIGAAGHIIQARSHADGAGITYLQRPLQITNELLQADNQLGSISTFVAVYEDVP